MGFLLCVAKYLETKRIQRGQHQPIQLILQKVVCNIFADCGQAVSLKNGEKGWPQVFLYEKAMEFAT